MITAIILIFVLAIGLSIFAKVLELLVQIADAVQYWINGRD